MFVRPEDPVRMVRPAFNYLIEHNEPYAVFIHPGVVRQFQKLLPISPIYQRQRHVTG